MSSDGDRGQSTGGPTGARHGRSTGKDAPPLLAVRDLQTHFPVNTGFISSLKWDRISDGFPLTLDNSAVKAVDGVDFEIHRGETLGVVGESGCGKSTLARTILRLETQTSGQVVFDGVPVDEMDTAEFRSRSQMVFQDPQSSLNPRRKVGKIIEDPLVGTGWPQTDPACRGKADLQIEGLSNYEISVDLPDDVDLVVSATDGIAPVPVTVRRLEPFDREPAEAVRVQVDVPKGLGAEVTVDETEQTIDITVAVTASRKELRKERAMTLLKQVGLKREYYNRYPHEFSGGQQQRINLARALSINPDLVIADEPVSGLDVSIQAQILNLMKDLQNEYDLSYLIISHNLSVIRYMADNVAVMYLGEFVEVAPADALFTEQYHPYSRALLGGVPNPNPDKPGVRAQISGNVASASQPPRGCRFHTRCPEFIQPEGFTEEGYEAFDELCDAVRDRDDGLLQGPIEDVVVDYLPESVPPGPRDAARRSLEQANAGEWGEAIETLIAHESICQSEKPQLENVGKREQMAACHLSFGE